MAGNARKTRQSDRGAEENCGRQQETYARTAAGRTDRGRTIEKKKNHKFLWILIIDSMSL